MAGKRVESPHSDRVFNGAARTIYSDKPYNDGKWHHVVATQGPGTGMRLYVDGTLQASNPQLTTSADYTGYWHTGGGDLNTLTDWKIGPGNPSSWFFKGQLDETAVYPSVLSPAQVAQQHRKLGTQTQARP